MGQAGAQREPSMEEILASIRRIIENNEPAADGSHAAAGEADAHEYDGDDAHADAEDAGAQRDERGQRDETVVRPVSLAEVAALARSVPKPLDPRNDGPRFEHSSFSARYSAERAAGAQNSVAVDESGPQNSAANVQILAEIDDAAAEDLRDALVSEEPVNAAKEPAEAGQGDPVAQEPARTQPDERRESTGQLVSLQTGEKVAAAFGELDAAIAAGQHRSFDEIAEEMLRPMLTQWLDDNLPTLVERLVREEIERVSRGNRR